MGKKPKNRQNRDISSHFQDSDLERIQRILSFLDEPTKLPKSHIHDVKNGYYPRLGFEAHESFQEIGKKLGITRQAAFQAYESAIKKLRKRIVRGYFEQYAQEIQDIIDDGDYKISDTPRRRTRRR
jgi:DNA-directed RNA polymerase sigma subunit (sigma70/sigma32)